MKEAPVKVGDVLAGKYRVEAILGMGGMGVVVEATHLDLQELRAIKLMLPDAIEEKEMVDRFMQEARSAGRLKSEYVARIHDVGRLDNGSPYIVMEHLEGADLRAVLKKRGRLAAPEAIHYALQACEALAEAHALGIVHRDLKPANLFLTTRTDGTPCIKLLDFGISKVLGAADLEMTKTQTVLGSPSYMSPEQMRSPRNVDARTDIWALGVILYRLLTGELPFRAESVPELVTKVAQGAPKNPSSIVTDLPADLDAVLLRCLERDLSRRYANVGELSSALLPFAPSEARASIERIARVLASASHGRGALPSVPRVTPTIERAGASILADTSPVTVSVPATTPGITAPTASTASGAPVAGQPGPPMRVASGDAWVNTAFGGGTIAVHRWKLWAVGAAAGALVLGGVVALVASRLSQPTLIASPAAVPQQNPAADRVAETDPRPPPPVLARSPAADTAVPVMVAAGPPSTPALVKGPLPGARPAGGAALTPGPRSATKAVEPPPPTATAVVPTAAPTAAHRMFGSEN